MGRWRGGEKVTSCEVVHSVHLFLLNKVLLCKWNWRYATERGTFWTQVISGKYGEEKGGWWSHEVRDGYGVGLWNPLGRNGILSWIVFLLWWAMGGG